MTEVGFYESMDDELLKFAVIAAKTDGKWVFCKHRDRETWEIPGGHREKGETIRETAERELREETGAIDFTIEPVCVYSVKRGEESESYGMLFTADVTSFEKELHHEIERITIADTPPDKWTYPQIQPKLLEKIRKNQQ